MERFKFSNFLPSPVVVDRVEYPTAEAAYQAGKTADRDWRLKLAACASPGAAKKMGKRVPLKPGWDRAAEMEKVLRVKFAPGTEWAEALVASGDEDLIEWNSWHDRYWGRCTCDRCGGEGENQLGEMLMRLRKELRERLATATPLP